MAFLPSQISQVNTALEWLNFGEKLLQGYPLFYGHGKDNAGDEAAALIAYALNISPEQSEDSLKQPLTVEQQKKLHQVFNQRIEQRLPTPYITQEIHFTGFPFYIDKRVIIPRSPMAEIIEQQFQPWIDASRAENISLLDLCCGSGCLGIASWLHCDFIDKVCLSDLSTEALEIAKINADKYELTNKIEIVQGDLFSALKEQSQCFDIMLCNPPYVDVEEMQALPAEYQHEPTLALDGRKNPQSQQQDGLEIVDQIMIECADFLHSEGWLFLEVGASKEAFEKKYHHLYPIEVELNSRAEGVYAIPAKML